MCGCGQRTALAVRSNRKRGDVRGEPVKFIRGHSLKLEEGQHGCRWKGGRYVCSLGYVMVRAPGHHREGGSGYVMEHILVAERILGRPIPEKHPVHHVDENRANNEPTNLVICESKAYHNLLHARMRALTATGNASAVICARCGRYDEPSVMRFRQKRWSRVAMHLDLNLCHSRGAA